MINALTGLGYGIIALAILVSVGMVIISQMAGTVAGCPTGFTYNQNSSGTVFTTNLCCLSNQSAVNCAGTTAGEGANASGVGSTATTQLNTISTYLGTGSGGLVTWIPVVVVLVIGLLFLGAFLGKRGKRY